MEWEAHIHSQGDHSRSFLWILYWSKEHVTGSVFGYGQLSSPSSQPLHERDADGEFLSAQLRPPAYLEFI